MKQERIHFIAIGGAAMHNLAIALKKKGVNVTGSDDQIFEPSRSRLMAHGLLPAEEGWFEQKITPDIDCIVLGMHAREDNPELIRAKALGVTIFSYPEFLYEQTKTKKRIVVGGSHGKTTTTAMILHVLRLSEIRCDFMVGAQIKGFDTMVELSNDAPIAVFEGDEYLSSPIDRRPKFHLYHPDAAIITGIAWDHMNVFPTWENYIDQFRIFIEKINPQGALFYCESDQALKSLAKAFNLPAQITPYDAHPATIIDGVTYLKTSTGDIPLKIYGNHNLQNLMAAKMACNYIGVTDEQFYAHIATFEGAAKRLQLLAQNQKTTILLDFAHAPSKVRATVQAVKAQFGTKPLIAILELHTFSSLNKAFLNQYYNTLAAADEAYVYFDPQVVAAKKLEPFTVTEAEAAFGPEVKAIDHPVTIQNLLKEVNCAGKTLLIMTSGNFSGMDLQQLANAKIHA